MNAVTKITSAQNENYKFWRELKSAKAIRDSNSFFLMGEKLIHEFLKISERNDVTARFTILSEVYPEDSHPLTNGSVKKFSLTPSLFKELDVVGTHFNLLLIKFSDFRKVDLNEKPKGLEVVAPLGDPGNMGALIRSALAFNVKKMILTKESCHPFHPRALKASAGASLHMNFSYSEESFASLATSRDDHFLDRGGKNIFKFQWPANLRLWIGEEGPGISKISAKNSERILSIPTVGVESLNATVAASLAISEWARNQK